MTTEENLSGFCEIPHTADMMLRIWAPDYPALLIEAARGMYSLMGIECDDRSQVEKAIVLENEDKENLLVMFLTELLYYVDEEGIVFNDFLISSTKKGIAGRIIGNKISIFSREIKAVTYHNLSIIKKPNRLEVQIVFDV